jgi:CNT family concentrative nucleoside transporter
MQVFRGVLGLAVIIGLAWLLSSSKRRFPLKVVIGGLVLQLILALLVLKTQAGHAVFQAIGHFIDLILVSADAGAGFVFGPLATMTPLVVGIKIMSTIIVCSVLSAVGYHYGILQRVVGGMARVVTRVLGVSGAEGLAGAANVFLGQTEAPLLVRPYIAGMTRSELMALMTCGFANIAIGVMVVYVDMLGIDVGGAKSEFARTLAARNLLTGSLMSIPAAFIMAKIMVPETETPATAGRVTTTVKPETRNGLDAATTGASDGMTLAINVLAMLIAFIALIKLVNVGLFALGQLSSIAPLVSAAGMTELSLEQIVGRLFAPIAFFIGVRGEDLQAVGSLLGTAMIANEYVAYASLAEMIKNGTIDPRSTQLSMYALCGFANLGSIGIQIAGIGVMAPSRRGDLAALAPRAMLGGAMSTWMTGCVAGMLIG